MLLNYLKKAFKSSIRKSFNSSEGWQEFHYGSFNKSKIGVDAYHKNVIVYRCVNLIAQSASHVPWLVRKNKGSNGKIDSSHPACRLLKKPNPEKGGADFFTEAISGKLLFGNIYILSTSKGESPPREIYLLPPNSTEIVINHNAPVAYKYTSSKGEKIYPIDPINRMSKVLHIKNYHPMNQNYGLSCLDPASLSIELHQQATEWNNALLKNGARPSGALIAKDSYLSEDQFSRLQEQIYQKFSGSNNSGRPLLLEGGLEWREMSINPKDMDFIESKNSASREIALAFGVPPQLLGINGDNTYSNMQEARLALWEETLIPLLDKLSDAFTNWLSYWYKEDIIVDFDRDAISALIEKRENLWSKIAGADFMTINEKRTFVGLGPIEGGNEINKI